MDETRTDETRMDWDNPEHLAAAAQVGMEHCAQAAEALHRDGANPAGALEALLRAQAVTLGLIDSIIRAQVRASQAAQGRRNGGLLVPNIKLVR